MASEFLMFWVRETLSNMRRNRLMSLLAVSTVTIGLFILGAFVLIVANLHTLVAQQTQKLDLAVFLKGDITPRRRKQVYEAVRIPQVRQLIFVSKAQVLREQKRDMPMLPIEDFQGAANPLGDELRLKLRNPEDIFKVHAYLQSIRGVKDVRMDGAIVHRLLAINRFLTVAGLVALAMLGMAILLIIHNAIRLTIFARRREIRIMELVGATLWFIRVPFLLEGTIYGLVGAVYAALVLAPLFSMATRAAPVMEALLPLSHSALMWQCAAGMVLAGLAFGLIGSWFSLSHSLGKAAQL